jgi:hypothetical protein
MNREDHSPLKVEVIDMCCSIGPSIEREEGVYSKHDLLECSSFQNPFERVLYGLTFVWKWELLLRIRTNFKLALGDVSKERI